jgi:EmrB/QacA subfamily drug resistance transporter
MLMLMLVLAALDQTIVSTALPSIAADLRGTSRISWVFSAYLITSTVAVPLYGKLADLHGTKPVLLSAMALFLLGSLLCGLARQMDELILARGLQGAGGGGLLTLAMMSVMRNYAPALRARLQGLLGASYGLSTMAGPLVGGYLVEHLSWRWAFFINLPAGLLALAVLASQFPRQRDAHPGRMDYPGAVLLGAGLVCLLLSSHRGEAGAAGPSSATYVAVGLVLLALFIWVQARSRSPLLPLSLFARRAFAANTALAATSGLALFATVVFMPLYFQAARHLTPADSGWHLMPLMAGITLASVGSGRMLATTGRVRQLAMAACLLSSFAFVALAWLVREPEVSLTLLSAWLLPLGLGIGALFPLVTVVAQNSAPMPLMGIATASPVMFRSVAGALGVSALATLFAHGMAGASGPAGFGSALSPVLWVAAATSLFAAAVAGAMPARLQRRSADEVVTVAKAVVVD